MNAMQTPPPRFIVSRRAVLAVNVASLALLLLSVALALVVPFVLEPPSRSEGAYASAFVLLVLSAALQHVRQRAEGAIISENGIHQRTMFGQADLPWSAVASVRLEAGRLILRGKSQRIVLPCNLFENSEELLRFVAEHIPSSRQRM